MLAALAGRGAASTEAQGRGAGAGLSPRRGGRGKRAAAGWWRDRPGTAPRGLSASGPAGPGRAVRAAGRAAQGEARPAGMSARRGLSTATGPQPHCNGSCRYSLVRLLV